MTDAEKQEALVDVLIKVRGITKEGLIADLKVREKNEPLP